MHDTHTHTHREIERERERQGLKNVTFRIFLNKWPTSGVRRTVNGINYLIRWLTH